MSAPAGNKGAYQSLETNAKRKNDKKLDFTSQTISLTAKEYDAFKDTKSGRVWAALPGSVIGTLLYFMKIEQNTPNFDLLSSLKAILLIGFPTYVTYLVQFLFVFGILQGIYAVGADGENAIADSICNISPYLLCAAIFTFAISMLPTYRGVLQSIDIVFNSKRVAYTESMDSEDTVFVTNLLAPASKRWLIFLAVNLFELFLACILTWCGVGYILSSDDVDDVLMNSLSVVFIMGIDDMAYSAFQTEYINEHISSLEFETSELIDEGHDVSTDGVIRPPSFDTYRTLWSIDQCAITLFVCVAIVYGQIYYYCP